MTVSLREGFVPEGIGPKTVTASQDRDTVELGSAAVGPRVVKTVLAGDAKSVTLTTDKDLLPTTLGNQSVLVSCLDTTKTSTWVAQANVANFDAAKKELVVSVPTPPVKGLIRLIVRGTGPNPVLGTDLTPFSGPGSTRPTAHDGVDFVYTVQRK